MKLTVVLIAAAAALSFLTACSDSKRGIEAEDVIRGSGVMVTQEWVTVGFDDLIFSGVGDINISVGASNQFTITVDDNILPYITHQLAGNRLAFGVDDDDVNLVDYDLTIDLTVDDLESITFAGVGNVTTINQLAGDHLDLIQAGSGRFEIDAEFNRISSLLAGQGTFELDGSTGHHACVLAGIGNIAAYGLVADTTVATLAGQGNMQLNTTDRLDVILSGIGNVYYVGTPLITWSITGTGSVIDAN